MVTVTVLAVNDAPVATADVYETDEDVELVVESPGVLANDDDVERMRRLRNSSSRHRSAWSSWAPTAA